MTETTETSPARSRRTPTWLVATIGAAFGLFFAYAVWNALGNLVEANRVAGEAEVSLSALGWMLWIFAAAFPIVVWGIAFSVGYRRRVHEYLLVMLTGLALVAVFWLNVVAYSLLNTASLIG